MRILKIEIGNPVRAPVNRGASGWMRIMLAHSLKTMRRRSTCLFFLMVIGMTCLGIGRAYPETLPAKAAVLISQNIRPYIEAADGAAGILKRGNLDVDAFLVDTSNAGEVDSLKESIRREEYDLLLSVGPEASSIAWSLSRNGECPVVYTMVLNPDKLPDAPSPACGISLSIPLDVQLETISQIFPSLSRIGLIYDPANNAAFYETAERLAGVASITVVPLRVSSRKEIARALTGSWGKIDGLWLIPDRTIISESIVQYIIKQALLNNRPVVGYNRFFYESGAAMSFIFDYAEIGEQAGRLALSMLASRKCESDAPVFQTWVNERVLEKLGIPSDKREASVIAE